MFNILGAVEKFIPREGSRQIGNCSCGMAWHLENSDGVKTIFRYHRFSHTAFDLTGQCLT